MLQVPDLKALMGDASDNIPGLKGIGIKTATQLLQKHGDLDAVFEHAAEEKKGVAAKLAGRQGEAALYKNLATVRWAATCNLVVPPCWALPLSLRTGVDRRSPSLAAQCCLVRAGIHHGAMTLWA
jgi:5'-3' exonuclease